MTVGETETSTLVGTERRRLAMLYLVVSAPHPSKPESAKDARLEFRSWIAELKSQGEVLHFYPRVGRGSIVILDVSSNDRIHELLTQWSNIVPAGFDLIPSRNAIRG